MQQLLPAPARAAAVVLSRLLAPGTPPAGCASSLVGWVASTRWEQEGRPPSAAAAGGARQQGAGGRRGRRAGAAPGGAGGDALLLLLHRRARARPPHLRVYPGKGYAQGNAQGTQTILRTAPARRMGAPAQLLLLAAAACRPAAHSAALARSSSTYYYWILGRRSCCGGGCTS